MDSSQKDRKYKRKENEPILIICNITLGRLDRVGRGFCVFLFCFRLREKD